MLVLLNRAIGLARGGEAVLNREIRLVCGALVEPGIGTWLGLGLAEDAFYVLHGASAISVDFHEKSGSAFVGALFLERIEFGKIYLKCTCIVYLKPVFGVF